jgi:hypothetical protein
MPIARVVTMSGRASRSSPGKIAAASDFMAPHVRDQSRHLS